MENAVKKFQENGSDIQSLNKADLELVKAKLKDVISEGVV